MASYVPKVWKDRVVDRPRTYTLQNNPDGTVTLIPAPGTIHEPGTPANAPNFNHIEQGIANAPGIAMDWAKSFGLGDVNPRTASDLNAEVNTGWVATGSTTLNNPPGSNFWAVMIARRSAERVAQVAFETLGNSVLIKSRVRGSAGWSEWGDVITSTGGTISGGNALIFKGASESSIFNANTAGREYLIIRSHKDGLSTGSAVYMYGNGDSVSPGVIRFYTNGTTALLVAADGKLYQGGSNEILHDGRLRWNASGYLEYNLNGTWIPTGDFPLGNLRNFDRNVTSGNGYTVARQWYTVFETSLPGRIESLFGQTEFTGRMEMRITIDGQAETIGDMDYDPGVSIGQTYPYVVQGEPPLTFRQGLKIEARARDMATAAKNLVSMRYRLRAGSP